MKASEYRNRRYYDDLLKLSPEEIVEVLIMESFDDLLRKETDEIVNTLTFSGIEFKDIKIFLAAHLPAVDSKGNKIRDLLIGFFHKLEHESKHGIENKEFTNFPNNYDRYRRSNKESDQSDI